MIRYRSPIGVIAMDAPSAVIPQLHDYFRGTRTTFDCNVPRGTAFQQKVWAAARRIPFGETRTYGEIARMIGKPGAARAVGNALNANPMMILIPCHRVVGASKSCGGFALGMKKKQWLLDHEKRCATLSVCSPSATPARLPRS